MASQVRGRTELVSIRMLDAQPASMPLKVHSISSLSPIFVVNDYLMGWLATLGIQAALLRRATEGGSYEYMYA